jgi:hypothetical protein
MISYIYTALFRVLLTRTIESAASQGDGLQDWISISCWSRSSVTITITAWGRNVDVSVGARRGPGVERFALSTITHSTSVAGRRIHARENTTRAGSSSLDGNSREVHIAARDRCV